MSRLRGLLVILAITAVAGCEAAPPEPAENVLGPAELTRTGGCGDAFLYVTNADDTIAVTINWAEAASRAQATGEFEATESLPHEEVSVGIQFGQALSAGFCTDIIEPGRPRMLAEAGAESGEVDIVVTPAAGAEPFMPLAGATVTLRNIVFEVPVEDTVETWRIQSLALPEVQVGWLAG